MGLNHSPSIVTNSLRWCLDAANIKSYPGILGSELVTNSIITQIDGITFNVFRDATQAFNLTLCNVEAGKTYYVDYLITSYTGTIGATFRISNSSGNLTPTLGINAAGRFNAKFTANVSGSLSINGDNAGTNFLVDYVSVREVLSGTGLTFFDLSGNGNNGTLTNGPTYNSSNGGAIVFDGTDDIVTTPSITMSLTAGYTAMMVIKWNGFSGGSFQFNQTPKFINFYTGNGVKLRWETYQANAMNSVASLSTGQIYIVAGTFSGVASDGLSGTAKIYINGVLDNTSTLLSGASITSSFTLGEYAGYFNGSIYYFLFYNKELTAAEIQQNFNALRGRFGI